MSFQLMEDVLLVGRLWMFANANASMVTGNWGGSKSMAPPLHVAERLFSRLRPQLCGEEQLEEGQRRQTLVSFI